MFSALAGALAGGLTQVGMGLYNNHFNAKEARSADKRSYKYAKKLSTWSALNLPSLDRQGLEAAGYNPMLALGKIGGSSASMAPAHSATSNLSFDGSSAKELGKFFEEMAKDKVKADVDNIKADTALKEGQLSAVESQRLQNEANTSLLMSQTERSDLAYGRDIAATITDIAGTGASLYSAKAMADVARSNANVNARNQSLKEAGRERSTTVQRYDKHGKLISTDEITESANPMKKRGVPTVQSTPNAKPNAGGLGHSAKTTSAFLKQLGKEMLWLTPLTLPFTPLVTEEGRSYYTDTFKRDRKLRQKLKFTPLGF